MCLRVGNQQGRRATGRLVSFDLNQHINIWRLRDNAVLAHERKWFMKYHLPKQERFQIFSFFTSPSW